MYYTGYPEHLAAAGCSEVILPSGRLQKPTQRGILIKDCRQSQMGA